MKTELAKVRGVADPAGVQSARPAQSGRPDRSRQGRALRLLGRRHQHRRAGRDRRPGGYARLRRRDELRADGAAGAANIRGNVDAIRAIPVALPNSRSEGADRLYRARRSRRGQARQRRRLYLPREQPALHPAEIQRARPRSRLDRGRGAGARRQERAAAAGLLAWNGRANSARCRTPRSGSR